MDELKNSISPHHVKQIALPDADVHLYPTGFTQEESSKLMDRLLAEVPWQQEYFTIQGKRIPFPRLTAWYGDPGKNYSYSGIENKPNLWTEPILMIKDKVEAISDHEFNSVLLNYYRDSKDSVSWHQDNEPELGNDPVIASVSFGDTRIFQMKHVSRRNISQVNIPLSNGSLLIMASGSQKYWLHRIPKSTAPVGARINLTFRYIY